MSSGDAYAEFLDDTGANTFPNLIGGEEIWGRFGVSQQRQYIYINDDGAWEVSDYGSLREDVEALIDA